MKKILIYSFEKFDKLETNPAAEVGKIVSDKIRDRFEVKFEIFGVSYDFKDNLEKVIAEFKPDFILGLGAAKRNKITVEKIALNVTHESKPDNKGVVLKNKEISKGEVALKTDFNCEKLVNYLKEKEIPCELSYFAGTYICNQNYFICLNYIEENKLKTETVFLHIPLSPKEVNRMEVDAPSFPPQLIGEALAGFLETYKN